MDNLTRIVKTEISRQYKSVRQFAFAVNIPLSTINSALHNGIGGSSFDTVVQICQTLGIKAISSDASFYLTPRFQAGHQKQPARSPARLAHASYSSAERGGHTQCLFLCKSVHIGKSSHNRL